MKVLCKHHPDIMGFATAFGKMKHETFLWQDTPAFDIFDEVEPNVFVSVRLDRAIEKCLAERPHVHTIIRVSKQENIWVIDGEEMEFPHVVDDINFHRVDPNPNMAADLVYIGETHPMIMELAFPSGVLNIKIFGTQPWPIPQYLGFVGVEQHCQAYSSAKIAFVTSTTEALRAMNCKTFCLTSKDDISNLLQIPWVEHQEDMIEKIGHFLDSPEERQEWIDMECSGMEDRTYTRLVKKILEEFK